MRTLYLFLLSSIILIYFGCKKENNTKTTLKADFVIDNVDTNEYKIASGDTILLKNTSDVTGSVKWDLGNGTFLNTENAIASYPVSGTYTVRLSITDKNGTQASVTKKIIVQDRVLENIIINNVYWNTKPGQIDHFNYFWPETATADLFVRLQVYKPGDPVVSGLLTNSKILYDSPIIPNVSNNTASAINIPVTDVVTLNKYMIDSRTLVLTLVAKDNSGKLYDLMSSNDSGCSWGFVTDNPESNTSLIRCQLFSSVQLIGKFR